MLLSAAYALACPTIATPTTSGATLPFDVAQVAIVRQNDRTTFSVSVNPEGERQDFALVMPVPEVLPQSAIHTLESALFRRLDAYSAPLEVLDPCVGSGGSDGATNDSGDADADGDADSDTDVDVEAEYVVGEYEIVILSAEESSSLAVWLKDHDYALPKGSDDRLAEYIEAGSYFLAAKVSADAVALDGTPLSPLQIAYDSELFAIPIRLATLNSPGEQDMIIYAITDGKGQNAPKKVGISNYPEFTIPDSCRWGNGDFSTWYEDRFTEAWTAVGDAGWTAEYSGMFGDCNPCSSTSITEQDLVTLGFTGDWYNHFFTRIRMRYTPEQAGEDLMLYGSGLPGEGALTFAPDTEANSCVDDVCASLTETPGEDEEERFCACASAPASSVLGLFAIGWVRRRGRVSPCSPQGNRASAT